MISWGGNIIHKQDASFEGTYMIFPVNIVIFSNYFSKVFATYQASTSFAVMPVLVFPWCDVDNYRIPKR